MANTLAALGVGGQTSILAQATLLSQAKNYSGAGKWFNEVGAGYFQPGSVLGAYIGPTSYGAGNALILPGVSGNYASAPDAAPLDITGDISLMACANPDWTPASTSNRLIAKNNVGTQCSYWFGVATTGIPFLAWSPDGTVGAALSRSATTAVPFADLATGWLAATLDVDNGAAGHDVKFYTSTDGSSWSQLGSTVTTAGTTSIHSGSAVLEMGTSSTGTLSLHAMTMFRSQVWTGVRDFVAGTGGTLAFDADFTAQATGTTSFTESSSNAATVTVTSTGADTNDPQWLPHSTSQNPFGAGVDYVYGSGVADNWVSTPDAAALDITGDITLLIRYRPNGSWSPAATHYPLAKYQDSNNISYALFFSTSSSIPRLRTSANGSTAIDTPATTGVPFSSNQTGWLAVSFDVDDGAGNRVAKFWTSTTDTNDPNSATWSQLGSTVTTAGTTSIFNSTSKLGVLGYLNGVITSGGFCSRAQVYSGVRDFSGTPSGGTLVADFNPNGGTINSTATSLTGTGDGLTWTINRAATGRKTVWVDRDRWLLGTDDRFAVIGITPSWIGTEAPYTVLIAFRQFGTTIGGGKILIGNGRAGVALNSGASIATTFSNQYRMHVSDGVSAIASNNIAVSTFNGTQSGFGGTYDPTAESIRLQYTANAGTSLTASLSSGLTDLGAVGGGTNYLGFQSTDSAYTDMEVVGVAVFNRVLSDAETQQAYQELYA